MTANYKNILLIKPSALGDVVTALPALNALRKAYPAAKIAWFVRPEFAPILDHSKNLDDMIIFDRKLLGKWWCKPKAFKALCALISQLRKGQYDLVIDLQGLFRTALFAWLTGSKNRYGMKNAREFASIFYSHKIDLPVDSFHVIDQYMKIAASAGALADMVEFDIAPQQDAVVAVDKMLTEHGIEYSRFAIFVPGAAHNYKCWPAKSFAELADRFAKDLNLPVIGIGTAGEKQLINDIIAFAESPVINFAGLTDIPQLTALLDRASLTITNDTGPGHFAVALNTPTVMIFGPTNPSRIRPYGQPNSAAAVDADNRPATIESDDPRHRIDAVTVDQVYALAVCRLEKTGEPI